MRIAAQQKPAPGELFVDHVSHFVRDLDAAALVLEKLGFKVTPESAQVTPEGPVGTSNRCAMLEEGYVEILAPRLDTPAAKRMLESIARFTGVHLACFGTPDAEGEHRRLAGHGFEPAPVVDLARKVDRRTTVRFKVVRTPLMPEGRIQYVQQLSPEAIWRPGLVNRAKLAEVYVRAADPVAAAARWSRFSGCLPRRSGATIRLETSRGTIVIAREFAWPSPPAPSIAGYRLALRHPDALLARCRKAGINVVRAGARRAAVLPPVLGGALIF